MILGIRKLACAVAAAYVAEPAPAAAPGRRRLRVPEFLLEIGCEEMPARLAAGLTEQLRAALRRAGRRASTSAPPTGAWPARPRAAWCCAARSRARQADREEKVWGPSLKVARRTRPAPGRAPPGLRAEERRARPTTCSRRQGSGDAGRAVPLLREEDAGPRRRRRCCPA